MDLNLRNHVILVTGGAKGIGAARDEDHMILQMEIHSQLFRGPAPE